MVTHGHLLVVEDYLDGLPEAHHILVDGVVEHLFEQHVDTIIGGAAITQLTDIHSRTAAYMLLPFQRYDVFFLIVILQYL